MELIRMRSNIHSLLHKINNLDDNPQDPTRSKQLSNLHNFINRLDSFLDDDLSYNVLNDFISNGKTEQCPLDSMCKNILNMLNEINPLLNDEILNYFSQSDRNSSIHMAHRAPEPFALLNVANNILFTNLLSAFEVLKHLHGHNKTLIILGPNGSGKTSFANYLKNMDAHIKVIPASKPIQATGYIPSMYNTSLSNYNNELYKGGILKEDLLQKLIIGMCSEHDDKARIYFDTGKKGCETIYNKTKSVFEEFFDIKLDDSSFSNKEIKATKANSTAYDFNSMSDGERAAFFYIATVNAAPDYSFIIVDEPENHLNPAIYNKIWNRLIEIRKDCQFIFITHTIEFISARSNYELVKIDDFQLPDKFNFVFLGNSLEDINTNLIVEIMGSRKPILFCEGTKSSYDYKIYENIWGDLYTIIPTGNCTSVERNVKACNSLADTCKFQEVIGIIDSDLKSDDEVEQLKAKKIYTLKCNEIEMILLDEVVFKKTLEHLYQPESSFDLFKNDLINKINERKQFIISRLVKTQIDEILHHIVIKDKNIETKDDFKKQLNDITTKINVEKLWYDCETTIDQIIKERNYEKALQFCCLEHGEVLNGLANKYAHDYSNIALGILSENRQLAKQIRNKYCTIPE